MRDRDMVSAIVVGDPAGLTVAYDRYAPALHAYCRSLLADPADAEAAVKDVFLVAVARLGRLRDPDRLRPWLYAVARNECHRRTRDRAAVDPPADPGREGSWPADADRPDPHELVDAAIDGLTAQEQDIVELSLRHELADADLAAVLAVSRRHAHRLASRARGQLEAALAALLVARAGPAFCPALSTSLADWDGGLLTAAQRRHLTRHIKRCAVCGERKGHKLRPTMLLGLRPELALPAALWRQLLGLVTDATAGGEANRARVAKHTEPFGSTGFPLPLDPPALTRAPNRSVLTTMVGVAALALLGTGTVIVTSAPDGSGPQSPGPVRSVRVTTPGTGGQAPPGAVTPVRTLQATVPVAAPIGVTASSVATPGTPGPSQSPAPRVTPGTLAEWPPTVVLRRPAKRAPPTGWLLLTASGGPVAFTVTAPAADTGYLAVTPARGSLAAGQSIEVRVTLLKGFGQPLDTQLTVDPGGLTVIVVYRPPPR